MSTNMMASSDTTMIMLDYLLYIGDIQTINSLAINAHHLFQPKASTTTNKNNNTLLANDSDHHHHQNEYLKCRFCLQMIRACLSSNNNNNNTTTSTSTTEKSSSSSTTTCSHLIQHVISPLEFLIDQLPSMNNHHFPSTTITTTTTTTTHTTTNKENEQRVMRNRKWGMNLAAIIDQIQSLNHTTTIASDNEELTIVKRDTLAVQLLSILDEIESELPKPLLALVSNDLNTGLYTPGQFTTTTIATTATTTMATTENITHDDEQHLPRDSSRKAVTSSSSSSHSDKQQKQNQQDTEEEQQQVEEEQQKEDVEYVVLDDEQEAEDVQESNNQSREESAAAAVAVAEKTRAQKRTRLAQQGHHAEQEEEEREASSPVIGGEADSDESDGESDSDIEIELDLEIQQSEQQQPQLQQQSKKQISYPWTHRNHGKRHRDDDDVIDDDEEEEERRENRQPVRLQSKKYHAHARDVPQQQQQHKPNKGAQYSFKPLFDSPDDTTRSNAATTGSNRGDSLGRRLGLSTGSNSRGAASSSRDTGASRATVPAKRKRDDDTPVHLGKSPSDSLSALAASAGKKKRSRNFWTQQEEENLIEGIRQFGVGRWSEILSRYQFNPCRDATALRDKWRNITK